MFFAGRKCDAIAEVVCVCVCVLSLCGGVRTGSNSVDACTPTITAPANNGFTIPNGSYTAKGTEPNRANVRVTFTFPAPDPPQNPPPPPNEFNDTPGTETRRRPVDPGTKKWTDTRTVSIGALYVSVVSEKPNMLPDSCYVYKGGNVN